MKDNYVVVEMSDDHEDVINQIIELAAQIGWSIAMAEEEELDHIIIGTQGALEEIDRTMEVYDIWTPPSEEPDIVH